MAKLIVNESVNKAELKNAIYKALEVLKELRVPNYSSLITFQIEDVDTAIDLSAGVYDETDSSIAMIVVGFDPASLNTQAIKGANEEIQSIALVHSFGASPICNIEDFNSVKLFSWQLKSTIEGKIKAIPYFEDNKVLVSTELSFDAGHALDPLDTHINAQHTTCNLVLNLYPM